MASMSCQFYSFSLNHRVDVEVFIPTPEGNEQITNDATTDRYNYEKGLPVLYLLHGAFGNQSSWLRFSNIERYAQKYCCAVVMAAAENSFYQDMWCGGAYQTFFAKELPTFIQNIFPVSKKREDTYIAGISMGGYGAWFLALSNPEIYSKAASLSGALDIALAFDEIEKGEMNGPFQWGHIFENPKALSGSSADLIELYTRCVKAGQVPALYQACGRSDFLYDMNSGVKNKLNQLKADLTYEEGKGGHEWDFWDYYIQRVLCWIFNDALNES